MSTISAAGGSGSRMIGRPAPPISPENNTRRAPSALGDFHQHVRRTEDVAGVEEGHAQLGAPGRWLLP